MFEIWCRRRAPAAILPLLLIGWLTGDSSEALTTFGKNDIRLSNSPPAPRECQRQAECAGTEGTSCVRTHYDATTRCLCGDNLPPVNGRCASTTKALYHVCENSDECEDGMICTKPIDQIHLSQLRVYGRYDKICYCDVENGYTEEEHTCRGIQSYERPHTETGLLHRLRRIIINLDDRNMKVKYIKSPALKEGSNDIDADIVEFDIQ